MQKGLDNAMEKRTTKQWHAEIQRKKLQEWERVAMVDLEKLSQAFPNKLTGKQSMELFSKKQLDMLQRLEERLDLDTRQTVERMLSEFISEMSELPNISERLTKLRPTWSNLQQLHDVKGLDEMDRAELDALLYTVAWGGRYAWTATRGRKGEIRLRAHALQDDPSLTARKKA